MVVIHQGNRHITVTIGRKETEDISDAIREVLSMLAMSEGRGLNQHQRKAVRELHKFWDDLEVLVEVEDQEE